MKKTITIKRTFWILFFACAGLGCTETVDFTQTCTVSGTVASLDEFGIKINDSGHISVRLDSTDISAITDENGSFTLKNVPTGFFDLVLEKEGYGTRMINGLGVYATGDTFKLNPIDLIQTSSIEIKNFRIEKGEYYLVAKGTIVHKFPIITELPEGSTYGYAIKCPRIEICYGANNKVSDKNYIRKSIYNVNLPSNSEFHISLGWMIAPPYQYLETNFYVAYGNSTINSYRNKATHNDYSGTLYDRNPYYYPTNGKPSNVFSITNTTDN